jgi:hypothetical protein
MRVEQSRKNAMDVEFQIMSVSCERCSSHRETVVNADLESFVAEHKGHTSQILSEAVVLAPPFLAGEVMSLQFGEAK